MVYQNKVVAVVKQNGKVLREDNDVVYLPFGAEYSILIKNLDSVRIKFRIFIDGEDATGWVICEPNSSVDMERFIRNGNLTAGNRFKFIERTEEIERHRGVGAEDGLIRVEYQREVKPAYTITATPAAPFWGQNWNNEYNDGNIYNSLEKSAYAGPVRGRGVIYNNSIGGSSNKQSSGSFLGAVNCTNTANTGITVPGSVSNQQFVVGSYFATGPSEYIVIHLKGKVNSKIVEKPVTVYHRPTCTTCGRTNKTTNRFCSNCGTSLTII